MQQVLANIKNTDRSYCANKNKRVQNLKNTDYFVDGTKSFIYHTLLKGAYDTMATSIFFVQYFLDEYYSAFVNAVL